MIEKPCRPRRLDRAFYYAFISVGLMPNCFWKHLEKYDSSHLKLILPLSISIFVCKSKTKFDINQVHSGSFNKRYELDGR